MSRFHTPSVRCTSVCTMEQIISCLRPSLYYQAPSRRIHFRWKRKSFFFPPFFKNCLSTRRVFVSFLFVQMCPFSFESAKAFSVFDNLSVHTWRFWYCYIIVSKSSVFKNLYTKTRKQRYHTWAHRFRKVPFFYNTQIFWSRLPFPRNNLTAFLRRWKLFEGCYRMTQIPESSVQKLEDRLNNNGCINFYRDKAFPLAATSNKQCVCLNSLPTTLLAISTDGDAASGPSSSCNIKCPGDAGESCFRTSCCGGPEQAYSIYATGGEWCYSNKNNASKIEASSQKDFCHPKESCSGVKVSIFS